jgi:hypothetical protein
MTSVLLLLSRVARRVTFAHSVSTGALLVRKTKSSRLGALVSFDHNMINWSVRAAASTRSINNVITRHGLKSILYVHSKTNSSGDGVGVTFCCSDTPPQFGKQHLGPPLAQSGPLSTQGGSSSSLEALLMQRNTSVNTTCNLANDLGCPAPTATDRVFVPVGQLVDNGGLVQQLLHNGRGVAANRSSPTHRRGRGGGCRQTARRLIGWP